MAHLSPVVLSQNHRISFPPVQQTAFSRTPRQIIISHRRVCCSGRVSRSFATSRCIINKREPRGEDQATTEAQLKNGSSGILMGSPAVALRPSTDSTSAADEDDTASFFDLELVDGELPGDSTTDSDEETVRSECNLAERRCCSTRSGGGALISDLILASPSDDLFFKGRLRPLDPASSPASKAGGKLRILMLGFKKPRTTASDTAAAPAAAATAAAETKRRRHSNFFVKFKAEEVPIVSLFTRDSSSKSSSSSRPAKVHAGDGGATSLRSEEKRPSDALQRYLSKIKPLYVRVSKRYGEKMRSSGPLSSLKGDTARSKSFPAAALSGGSLPVGMKQAGRRLGKSRSASSAVAAVQSPPSAAIVRRRDDSLLEQQDGIQSAIAHCKRSFNSGREEGST